jgi:holliday junction DNA helicase RuvA
LIAQLRGNLAYKAPGEVVLDVGGVGYQVYTPLTVFYGLPEIGAPVSLYIHTHLREDALQLFGFQEPRQKDVFLLLTAVAGIGPRLAVNILSGIPVDDLLQAIRDADQMKLISIPGVGRKLAERMVVELRDKLVTLNSRVPGGAPAMNGSQMMQDAVSALVNLGYRQGEVEKVVRDSMQSGKQSLEDVIKDVLRRLSR